MSGYINDLSVEQGAALEEIKSRLPDMLRSELQDPQGHGSVMWNVDLKQDSRKRDVVLLKFLRARDFNLRDTDKMLRDCLRWREKMNIPQLLQEEFPPEFTSLAYYDGFDKRGNPILCNFYGTSQPSKIFKGGVDRFIRWRVQVMEEGIQKYLDMENTECMTMIHDYKKVGLSNFTMDTKNASKKTIKLMQDNYPEFLAAKFFINIPTFFVTVYEMITLFVNARTKAKFVVCDSKNYYRKMTQVIDPDQLPQRYRK